MTKEEKLVFADHYDSLSEEEKVQIRERFTEVSGLKYSTFYQKKKKKNFTPLEQRALEEICEVTFSW